MKQYKALYFLGLFLIFNQSQIVNSAQKENSFYDIISRENLIRVIRKADTLIHQYNQLKDKAKNLLKIDTLSKEEVDKLNEYLVKIKKNIYDLAENSVALQNFPNEYEKRKKNIENNNSSNIVNEFLSALSSNTKKNFKEREDRIDVMPRDYNEFKSYINRIESEKGALPAASSGQPSTGVTVSAITGKYTEKEAKEAVALAKKENIDEIDTILQNNNNYSNTEKRKIYKLVDIVKKFKKKFIGISEDAREAMYEDFFEQNGVDNPRVQMIIIRDFINPEETSEKSNQNTSQKAAAATSSASPSTGATASSAQPGKYTVKDAQTALDYVNKDAIKNEDFWEDVSKELDKKNIGEPQKENILQLIEIIIKIKENQNKITLKKKLAEAQQELHQSHEEDDDLKIFYPITDANITKIILEGIEKQLKSEKDQDKSADDDFDSKDNTQELQRKLAQLEKEESTARSSIQGNELEAEMAKIRAQLEQELEKELRRNQDSKLNQKPSDQQQGIEEELATLEQQSIDKLFMNKVARNASNWITKLPEGKQVTQDAVRKLLEKDPALEKNLTDAQLLYVNGFLQAMKL